MTREVSLACVIPRCFGVGPTKITRAALDIVEHLHERHPVEWAAMLRAESYLADEQDAEAKP